MRLRDIIAECRPHQYLKNGFVLVGPLFSEQWTVALMVEAALTFMAFCLMASAVYCCNDLLDAEADRKHPTKRHRPIASGAISPAAAWTMAAILAALSVCLGLCAGPWVLAFLLGYAAVNLCYSLFWKHVPVIDVFLISAGFMLRLFAGTTGLGITTSSWLLLCGMMLTLFLGFSKRRAELLAMERRGLVRANSTRKVLDEYSPGMIEQFTAVSAACTILSYSLYTVAPETISKHHTNYLIATVPIVTYGIFRYLFLLHQRDGGQDTARDVLLDKQMLATGLCWALITFLVLLHD